MPTTKLKRVDRSELKPGLQVVVNDLPDTYVYTVDSVSANGFVAELSYESAGTRFAGGHMDVSGLYHPSKKQLAQVSH